MEDIAESGGIYKLADYVFSVARDYIYKDLKGREITIADESGIVKLLKNRLTGKLPYMTYDFKSDMVIKSLENIYNEPKEEKEISMDELIEGKGTLW